MAIAFVFAVLAELGGSDLRRVHALTGLALLALLFQFALWAAHALRDRAKASRRPPPSR